MINTEGNSSQFNDPKVQLLSTIVRETQTISDLLNAGYHGSALKRIAVLLMRLDVPSGEKEVLALRSKISLSNYTSCSYNDLYNAYFTINDFLNRTYFKGWNNIMPRSPETAKVRLPT